MDLEFGAADEEFRGEVRAWLREHVPARPLPSLETGEGFARHREWERTLGAARLGVVSWPEEYGGRGASVLRWLVFEEEYYAAGAPGRVSQNGINLLAPTLLKHGTPEQLARILPPMAAGEVIWAQAWSEPGAGSDLAALRATATRTDGGWLLDGQKTWSSRAAFADRGFGLFRSDPESSRHKGLTYLMFPLDAEGVTVRPIGRLDGKPAFAELFLDRVFVPDEDVIGAPGDGWRVAMATAGNERGLTLRSPGRFTAAAERLVELWKERADASGDALRDRVADAWIRARAYRLKGFETVSRDDDIGAESSLNKVFWSELDVALHETALDLLGPDGELESEWLENYVFSLAGPIYAGTNEIQRNVIAERLLGLPRGSR
ncbi:acyl-CoA dehydrogenase family protein [Actinomadura luteofluorescens]|uniref:Alkylation response protein AidB-like acyl-CoA dehydrogenase n=1 Tax=Actinomadura luteofluorescens TaxID=46163 RepID=A0A7Y9ELN5_9ACTN|nr:acyl-CoA dehydrogenase family protein [Actinomadura luteofluorescens]NYD50053.1 alkylation response protein AidB-like acyl-CoA dehydrogenase [Actinomadura luteofluorescens]